MQISEMKSFDMQSDRVDEWYSKVLSRYKDFAELLFIVRQVLIFSHGNACGESGFSIKKNALQKNMKNESLVTQRIVFDGIQPDSAYLTLRLLKINISQDILRDVRNSHKEENAKENNRKKQTEAENQKVEKKRLSIELEKLKKWKKATITAASKCIETFDSKIFAIEETLRTFWRMDFI